MNRLVSSSQGITRWIVLSVKESQDESSHLVKEAQDKVTSQFVILILNNASKIQLTHKDCAQKEEVYESRQHTLDAQSERYNQLDKQLEQTSVDLYQCNIERETLDERDTSLQRIISLQLSQQKTHENLEEEVCSIGSSSSSSSSSKAIDGNQSRNRIHQEEPSHHRARRCIPFEWL